jgi:hypothetical protein
MIVRDSLLETSASVVSSTTPYEGAARQSEQPPIFDDTREELLMRRTRLEVVGTMHPVPGGGLKQAVVEPSGLETEPLSIR